MATLTSIVKDGLHLVFTYDDGTVVRRSIVLDNTVVSEPLDGYEEVGNIYVNHATGELIVNYNGQSITLGVAGVGAGDMLKSTYDTDEDGVVDNSEELGGDTLAQVETTMDNKITAHVAVADPHTGYVLKSLFDTGTLLYAAGSGNPEAKTRAELLALLSGQADAAFNWNGQDLNNIGHIGLGNQASQATSGIHYEETYILGDNDTRYGIYSSISGYKTSADYIGNLWALSFTAKLEDSNTRDWTATPVGLVGVGGIVETESGMATTKTVAGIASFYAEAIIGDAANDMIVTNYYGLYVNANSLVGNSKLTNDYGIYIGNQAGGATLNYAIYTNAGLVHFGDNVEMASGKTVDGVDVSGIPAQSLMFALCS